MIDMEKPSNIGKYTYFWEQENLEFDMFIDKYWETIYRGKPRERLYDDYISMLTCLKRVSKDKICIDIGGNHGLFAVPASKIGYKVVSFEPVKANFDSLCNNLNSNSCQNYVTVNKAASNVNEKATIFVPLCPDNASLNQEAAVLNMHKKDFYKEEVECIRLDDWVKENPQYSNIGFIKSDTQGNCLSVFSGFSEFLKQANDIYIIAEFEEHLNKMGHSYDELQSLIIGLGFRQVGTIGNDRVYYKQ